MPYYGALPYLHATSIFHEGLLSECGLWVKSEGAPCTDDDARVTCPNCRDIIVRFCNQTGRPLPDWSAIV